jgi:hypothetical protein
MENYIRDKYERKLFMADCSSGSSGPMSLKSKSLSEQSSKNNIMDNIFLDDSPSSGSSAFKTSASESYNSNFSKQLALLSEMGFTDTDFNYKTLKAANGNMQEALEIIVAANQKQRRKTVDKNIFDEIEEARPSFSEQTATKIDEDSNKETFKSPPPIDMDDWSFNNGSKVKDIKNEAIISEPEVIIKEENEKSNNKQAPNNPWGNNFVDDSISESEPENTEDPFDSYKAFRSTPSDNYFDNPW